MKYDLKDNGRFAYCDFLQSCVLLLRAKETSLMQRMKIQNADKMVGGRPRSACGSGGNRSHVPQLITSKGGAAMQRLQEGPLVRTHLPVSPASLPPGAPTQTPPCTCICRSHSDDVWA